MACSLEDLQELAPLAVSPQADAMLHWFDDDLMCECGVSWEEHQKAPEQCPRNAQGHYARRNAPGIPRRRSDIECHKGHPRALWGRKLKTRRAKGRGWQWVCRRCKNESDQRRAEQRKEEIRRRNAERGHVGIG